MKGTEGIGVTAMVTVMLRAEYAVYASSAGSPK